MKIQINTYVLPIIWRKNPLTLNNNNNNNNNNEKILWILVHNLKN